MHNPGEYFLLEYRKSRGGKVYRPDAALPEEGRLILHMTDRLGVPDT